MIVVIGGTGKVGSALLPELSRRGMPARVVTRTAEKDAAVATVGLEPVRGDARDLATLRHVLHGADALFLLTPPSEDEGAVKRGVVDAARRAGIRHIVLLSGAGASAQSPISQAREHAHAEEALKASTVKYTILQPYFFMQNFFDQAGTIRGNFGNGIRSQGAIYGNVRDGRIAMVDTRDVAAVAAACLCEQGHEGRTYVVTGGSPITNAEAAAAIARVAGRPVQYVDVPSEQLIAGMTAAGVPRWLASDLALLGEEIAGGAFASTTDVVERVAGRRPITFEQFAEEHRQRFA